MASAHHPSPGVQISVPPRNPETSLPSPERCASRLALRGTTGGTGDRSASVLSMSELAAITDLATSRSFGEVSPGSSTSMSHSHCLDSDRDESVEENESEQENTANISPTSPHGFRGGVADDPYYKRLLELKEKNMRTLKAVEKLYRQHVQGRCLDTSWKQESWSGVVSKIDSEELSASEDDSRRHSFNEDGRALSAAPAEARSHAYSSPAEEDQILPDLSRYVHSDNDGDDDKSTPECCSSLADSEDDRVSEHDTLEDQDLPTVFCENHSPVSKNPDFSDASGSDGCDDWSGEEDLSLSSDDRDDDSSPRHHDVIEGMWDSFSVEYDGASSYRKERQKSSWSPRTTIPEPFEMTWREERRRRNPPGPSKCLLEAEHQRLLREQEELAALSVKFKAKEVPSYVKMPVYEKLRQEEEERRAKSRQKFAEQLVAEQEPFSFLERERSKKENRLRSAAQKRGTKPGVFRAKPLPKHLFDDHSRERELENELYRQIRMHIRSEELLASSRLPCSMATRKRSLRYTNGHMRHDSMKQRSEAAFLTKEHKFQPRINPGVPDFGELHRRLQKQTQSQQQQSISTAVKPFFLRTELMAQRKCCKRQGEPSSVPSANRRQNRSPPQSTYVGSADSFHTRATRSSHLRSLSAHERLSEHTKKAYDDEELRHKRNERERLVRQRLASSRVNDRLTNSAEGEHSNKLVKYR